MATIANAKLTTHGAARTPPNPISTAMTSTPNNTISAANTRLSTRNLRHSTNPREGPPFARLAPLLSPEKIGFWASVPLAPAGRFCLACCLLFGTLQTVSKLVIAPHVILPMRRNHTSEAGLLMDEIATFARNAATARARLHLSQTQVSSRSGIHVTEVSRIERGLRDPRLSTLIRLARALEVDLAGLLEGIS